ALRVQVDEQGAGLPGGEGGRQVHGRGGLAHPTLLVHDRKNERHAPSSAVVRREYHAGPTCGKVPKRPHAAHLQRLNQAREGAAMKIALVLGQGFEDSELRIRYDRLTQEGYEVDLIGLRAGEELNGYRGKEKVKAGKGIDQVRADDYDALV